MEQSAINSPTADVEKRRPGRPAGTCAIVLALRRSAPAVAPEAPPSMQPDRRGGRRPGAGRPPRDAAARSAWEAKQAARRTAEGKPPKPKDTRGGARLNGGRRKGDTARANETALELARRWMQEQQTMAARWRREMRAWITRNKLAP
jgi:hypothetical protein